MKNNHYNRIIKEEIIEQLRNSNKLGVKYYGKGDCDLAEEYLIQALKLVLSKSLMKNIYIDIKDVLPEALNSMYHLGIIYLQNQNYFNNYAKAADIFQYCAGFAKKYNIEQFNVNEKQGRILAITQFENNSLLEG